MKNSIKIKYGKSPQYLLDHMKIYDGIDYGHNDICNLLLLGYFHGYKACRFIVRWKHSGKFQIIYLRHLNNFKQVKKIYDINNELRILFYPIIMQIGTGIKNYIISTITQIGGIYLNDIFYTCFKNYKTIKNPKRLKYIMNTRTSLENAIVKNQPYEDILLTHYIKNDEEVPLWAVFELITFGLLGNFINCLKKPVRRQLELSLGIIDGIDKQFDGSYTFLGTHVHILTGLRNAIAHNKIIYDCRFKGSEGIKYGVKEHLKEESHSKNPINFSNIIDYFILMAYYQHLFKVDNNIINYERRKLKNILQSLNDNNLLHIICNKKSMQNLEDFYFS